MEQAMFRDGLTVEDFFLTEEELESDRKAREDHTAFLLLSMELDREPPPPLVTNHIRKYLRLVEVYRTPEGAFDDAAFMQACDRATEEANRRKAAEKVAE